MSILKDSIDTRARLKIKARHKYVSYILNQDLLKVPGISFKEMKRFNRAMECNTIQNFTVPGELTSRYCNSRACLVCSRSRSRMYEAKYLDVFNTFEDPCFLTLTFQNVPGSQLKNEVHSMVKNFQLAKDSLRKEKIKIKGLRKLEVTYNQDRNDYHPHYHIVLNERKYAERIQENWLQRYGSKATEQAQNIRDIDKNSYKELFKYFAKIFKKNRSTGEIEYNPGSLVTILRSLENKRIVQPFGIKAKIKDLEEPEHLTEEQEKINFDIDKNIYLWEQDYCDWLGANTGEILSGYEPTDKFRNFTKVFNNGKT